MGADREWIFDNQLKRSENVFGRGLEGDSGRLGAKQRRSSEVVALLKFTAVKLAMGS
jgi:hypothetical protein